MFDRGSMLCLLLAVLLEVSAHAAPAPSAKDQAILRAAVDTAELSPSRTRSLRLRLHLAPLLPQLRVTFGRGWQLTASRDFLLETPQTDNDRVNYALSAHWDLARLVMPHEELQLAKEEQRRALLRLRLQERVARLLAERCHLHRQAGALSRSDEQKRLSIEATLTVLTGGRSLPPVGSDDECSAPPLRIGGPSVPPNADPERGGLPSSDPTEDPLDPAEPRDGSTSDE